MREGGSGGDSGGQCGQLAMGDEELAALRAQLAERDAKILEVKEKAKQFVREKMAASAAAIEDHKASAARQDAAIAELRVCRRSMLLGRV